MRLWGPLSLLGLVIAALAFGIDQTFKWWMLSVFDIGGRAPVRVLPIFDLVLAWNRGISYGWLASHAREVQWLLTLASIAVSALLWIWAARTAKPLVAAALGLIIGGALANALDRMVHGAVKSVGGAAFPRLGDVGDQSVSRRGPDPLADAVQKSQDQNDGPPLRQADEGSNEPGQPIPADDKRFAPPDPVGPPSGNHFQECRGGLGDPFNKTELDGPGAQDGGKKEGEKRVDHLAGKVGEEASQAQDNDRAGEFAP